MNRQIAIVLLAAGHSRRMGQNKLLLPWAGGTVVGHTLHLAAGGTFCQRLIVTCYPEVQAMAQQLGVQPVWNVDSEEGIASSIRLGVSAVGPCDGYLFCNCDQPCMTGQVLDALCEAFDKEPAIWMPRIKEGARSPALFPVEFREELLALRGDRGGRQIIQRHPDQVRFLDFPDGQIFMDVDTWEQYQAELQKK
ncbi:MAG: nucleotidyltransferase family protein [Eubacteriales bacterium]|jgi:molybdenum cofactor cytidylyltransferase